MNRQILAAVAVLVAVTGCRSWDARLVADATTARVYGQCRYELLCVADTSKWQCKVAPPPVRPTPIPGQCVEMYHAEEELRWQAQTAELARADTGRLPAIARKALKAAKKALDGLR